MPWSKSQVVLAHVVKSQLHWEEAKYRLLLRNVAGIRPVGGKVSSTNLSANSEGFERLLAFAESQGFVDPKNGQGYWSRAAQQQCARIHHLIRLWEAEAIRLKLTKIAAFLPSFIERQTAADEWGHPQEPKRALEECNPHDSYNILEGLKKWLSREAEVRGLRVNISV